MQTGPARILIVDDEPEVYSLIRGQLSKRGFDCHLASEPGNAEQLLCSRHFDLVITDVSMPRISGLDLLTRIRQQGFIELG